MSRAIRQSKILSIITQYDVETQEDLVRILRGEGFDVTQATVSRDIKELGLIKSLIDGNKYKYATKQTIDVKLSVKLLNVVREAVISIVTAENTVVVKTISDSASAVAGALEQLSMTEALGILAQKSTILIVCANARDAEKVNHKINQLL